MSARIARAPHAPGLAVTGDLMGDASRALEREVAALLAEPGLAPGPLVLDLSGVSAMDSAAFTVWVAAERRTLAAGRKLLVKGASPLIRKLFLLADLEDVLLS